MNSLAKHLLETVILREGSHKSLADGVCVNEAVAWYAGEPHSDRPACECPIIGQFARNINDSIRSDELRTELLRPLIPRLAGSKSTRAVETKRGFVAADWAVRVFLPIALEADGRRSLAQELRELPPVVDCCTAYKASEATEALGAAHFAAYSASCVDYSAATSKAAYDWCYAELNNAAFSAACAVQWAAHGDDEKHRRVYQLAVECIEAMLAVQS